MNIKLLIIINMTSRKLPEPYRPPFFKNFIYLIYVLFLAVLDPRCCVRAFSSCSKRGFSCCGAQGPGVQASVVVARVLSSCGSRA